VRPSPGSDHPDRHTSAAPSHRPAAAAAVPVTSTPAAEAAAHPQRRSRTSWTASTEAVEKVVYPPRNPVPATTAQPGWSAAADDRPAEPSAIPTTRPSSSEPLTLMTAVDHGKVRPGKRARMSASRPYRHTAPRPPATPTRTSSSGLTAGLSAPHRTRPPAGRQTSVRLLATAEHWA